MVTAVAGEVVARTGRGATIQTTESLVSVVLGPSTVFASPHDASILRHDAEVAAEGRWEGAEFYATAVGLLYRTVTGVVRGSSGRTLTTSAGRVRFDADTRRVIGDAQEPVAAGEFLPGDEIALMGWREPGTDVIRAVWVR